MERTVEIVGEKSHTVDVPADATVADLVAALPVSIHEVSVLADGQMLPADANIPSDTEELRVIRLIKGG